MNTDIHRLLDEAFEGIVMTPEARDLKEEIRANLIARTDELESAGAAPADAAARAIAELGDVHGLLDDTTDAQGGRSADAGSDGGSVVAGHAALIARHRVRPTPGFVVRVIVWSVAAAAGITLALLGATAVLPLPLGPEIAFFGVAATGLGLLVGDSLSQETTTNHAMPRNRASSYALATFLGAYGLAFAGLIVLGPLPVWGAVFAAVGVIASIILFSLLGATQTNRHKAWTRRLAAETPPTRFEREPETAARLGMYSAAVWLVTLAVIVVLVFTVGWWWAPVAFVGGLAVMLLLLARMLFAPDRTGKKRP